MQAMSGAAVLLLAFLTSVAAISQDASVTPVQKVIQMMGDLKAKALKEKQDEVVMFTKFKQFCDDASVEKASAIEDGQARSFQLTADGAKYTSDANVLANEIAALDASISMAEGDLSEATALRKNEKADYMATHADYQASIGDLTSGITRLKTMMTSMPGASAASLLQTLVSSASMPTHAKSVLAAFISTSQTPAAPVYESRSGGIVDMMKGLLKKLEDERTGLEKDEMRQESSFQLIAQTLHGQISKQTDSRSQKVATKKAMEGGAARAKGDLSTTESTLAEDTHYAEDLKVMCEQKATDFEARQSLRAGELDAINQAIEIVSSGAVSGAAGRHLPSLVQLRGVHGTALVQLRSSGSARAPSQSRASDFLLAQGKRLNSNVLAALALHVSDDPMAKVKSMIKNLVEKLMEEANEEAEHKGFCDTEMGTNKNTRDRKTTQVSELTANIEQMTAERASSAANIAELTEQVAASDAAVSEASSVREQEKAKSTATIADAKAASVAVERAIQVLKEFYDKAASATALVQKGLGDDAPATFNKPFKGSGGEGGIVGMLEVILSDFERLESSTTQGESAAQTEYDQFMIDSKKDTAVKNAAIKHNTNEQTRLDSDLQSTKKDLKGAGEELDAANAYFEKLKPSCVEEKQSYAERVAMREEEIESLKEATTMLSSDDIA